MTDTSTSLTGAVGASLSSAPPVAIAQALVTAAKQALWVSRLSEIYWINSVAISDDGKRIVAATFIHDYRLKSDKLVPNVQGHFGVCCLDDPPVTATPTPSAPAEPPPPRWLEQYDGWDGVFGVALSGDGKVAAAGGWLGKTANLAWGMVRAYDADTGEKILDYTNVGHRISWVVLSKNGQFLVAVADDVYVFVRDNKAFNPVPFKLGINRIANGYVTAVAIHPSGEWLAACDQIGHVYTAPISRDALGKLSVVLTPKTAGERIPFLSIAIASQEQTFVVGGGNSVFLFDALKRFDPVEYKMSPHVGSSKLEKDDGRIQENVRWVAISENGEVVSAVANSIADNKKGVLVALRSRDRRHLEFWWQRPLDNNPNSTSIDANSNFIAASDGYPTGQPAKFYLFDGGGAPQWDATTYSMNWPMVINSGGTAAAAGSDDGSVYYFKLK